MTLELENLKIGNEIALSVNSTNQAGYSEIIKGRNIASATISYRPFKFGVVADAPIYRKFFYNDDGRVIKKLEFDTDGNIVSKEESVFDTKHKWKILQSRIITGDDNFTETYEYTTVKGKEKLKKHTFFSPKWPQPKKDEYEFDELGRIAKKVSYGIMGEPELISSYVYDTATDTKVTYRHVFKPDGGLVITLMYGYDNVKKEKQTGLYSFLLTPDEITELRNSDKKNWELKSLSRSKWEYDSNANNIGFERDDMVRPDFGWGFDLIGGIPEYPSAEEAPRVLIEKSSSDYEKLGDNYYLVRTTEWDTRINEPLKAAKEYMYMDKKGTIIYP